MPDAITTIGSLKEAVRAFAAARQWEPYHTPKNIAMALACEVGELLEPFRWLTGEESRQACLENSTRQAIADELADVACLVFQFSVASGIDVSEAVAAKMVKNAVKYPVSEGK
jgi:NTP pyrophosphatase (non-canonical NTP hydrolase)